ncbi:MAG: alkaline phosphatase family protein [Rhodospirillales bacterium]|nr:alkaline phosphatase family protein [Rhodospirillales bacterium]
MLEAEARGLKIPNLRLMSAQGSFSTGVRGVLPTLTYPSHTTLMTGMSPARHGIVNNLTFDPLAMNQQGWFWYASDIKAETLWDGARAAHLNTANIHWPVSIDAPIDLNLPQIWRTGTADDRKLLRALSTRGLYDRLERELGPYADGIDESIEADENRARFGIRLIEGEHPRFTTLYYTALDHTQHLFGPEHAKRHARLFPGDARDAVDLYHRWARHPGQTCAGRNRHAGYRPELGEAAGLHPAPSRGQAALLTEPRCRRIALLRSVQRQAQRMDLPSQFVR